VSEVLKSMTPHTGHADKTDFIFCRKLDAGYWFTTDGSTYPYRGKGITVPTLEEVSAASAGP
jgi:glycerophosphoryl diester phosphodiesterase